MELDRLTDIIIGCAISVHRTLGPGLLESTYEACMGYELTSREIAIERQKAIPVVYRGVRLDCGYRLDMIVEKKIVLEIKAIVKLEPIHTAQLLTYLKLSECPVGLLINFNEPLLKNGLRRVVNKFEDPSAASAPRR